MKSRSIIDLCKEELYKSLMQCTKDKDPEHIKIIAEWLMFKRDAERRFKKIIQYPFNNLSEIDRIKKQKEMFQKIVIPHLLKWFDESIEEENNDEKEI